MLISKGTRKITQIINLNFRTAKEMPENVTLF